MISYMNQFTELVDWVVVVCCMCGQANESGIAMVGQNQCILERLLDVFK